MSQLVILNLGKGSLQQGFPEVIVQLWETETAMPLQFTGSLPAAPDLPQLYQKWRSLYTALQSRLSWRRIEIEAEDVTNISPVEFNALGQALEMALNRWLNADTFGKIERQLRTNLTRSAEIRLIIATEDPLLRKFPWHLWNFFADYPQLEIALGVRQFQRSGEARQRTIPQVKILAILGNNEGIDIQQDRQFLEQLPGVNAVFLAEPQRWELNHWLWDDQGWDVLYFAGHSRSQADGAAGEIAINPQESLTIDQLKHALEAAIARGLKLAIFNSCDGLGLARAMADLNIPQMIVMREPVPDRVAQAFLKQFLSAFSSGRSLYQSVREARAKLQGIETEFPGASWLPVICQNPAEVPPTWVELRDGAPVTPDSRAKQQWRKMGFASLLAVAVVMGARHLGLLQPIELTAWDALLRSRPVQSQDDRLLIIEVTETDVQAQSDRQGGESLTNGSLLKLLEKIAPYQPALIGLDIYRDYAIAPQDARLKDWWQAQQLRDGKKLIGICTAGEGTAAEPGVPPPAEIAPTQLKFRAGLSDVLNLDSDRIVRRYSLGFAPPQSSRCQTTNSFGLLLALTYLNQTQKVPAEPIPGGLKIGNVLFPTLTNHVGGYHALTPGKYQIPINYRPLANPEEIAPKLTLDQVLRGDKLKPELIKNRIVLIGTTAPSYKDYHLTPYGRISGVVLHAHLISQILTAVEENAQGKSAPIWWLPWWGDALWVAGFAGAGAIILGRFRSIWGISLASGGTIAILLVSSYFFMLQGGWMPLIPSAIAFIITSGTVFYLNRTQS